MSNVGAIGALEVKQAIATVGLLVDSSVVSGNRGLVDGNA